MKGKERMTRGMKNRVGGNGMMNNRTKRMRLSRLVAGLLCLCILISGLGCNALKILADETPKTHAIVEYWHADGSKDYFEKTLSSSADNFPVDTTPDKGERFTAFSLTAGQSAVELSDDMKTATIKYDQFVHLVKVHVFYSSSGDEAAGLNIGTKLEDQPGIKISPENDTTLLNKDKYLEISGSDKEDLTDPVKVYDTSEGLHTDKTATVSALADVDNPRTFDVELETWFAGSNKANVGLILDASGSMAFASNLNVFDGIREILGDEEWAKLDWKPGSNDEEVAKLTPTQVETILGKSKTSNSLLDYGDYSYFVFDGRPKTMEYVPLGYWDGNGLETEKVDSLEEGLIGRYTFDDNTLKNTAPTAIDDEKAVGTFLGDKEYFGSGINGGRAVQLYRMDNSIETKPVEEAPDIMLDTKLKNAKTFTISFAIQTKKVGNNAVLYDQNMVFIGDWDDTNKTFYSIFRGSRGKEESGRRIRWDVNQSSSEQPININTNIDANAPSLRANTWTVLTFTVDNGKVSVYFDGEAVSSEKNGTGMISSLIEGGADIVLGGLNKNLYQTNDANLYMDEVYIYNRALDSEEVKKLFEKTKNNTTSSTDIYVARVNDGSRNIAQIKNGKDLKESGQPLNGWYYTNSTQDLYQIHAVGTAKVLQPLFADKSFFYEDVNNEKNKKKETTTHDSVSTPPDWPTGKEPSSEDFPSITTGPCMFYTDSSGRLGCVFNPTDNYLSYSYVYEKSDDDTIKKEVLQEALGNFVNKLDRKSPKSQVSAVRFSTDNYSSSNGNLDHLVMLDWTEDPEESASILNLRRGDGSATDFKVSEKNKIKQYNYLLTGGTNAVSGLQSFSENLKNTVPEDSDSKYLILFTDGVDDSLSEADGGETAKNLAEQFRKEGWTIYCVMLTSTGLAPGTDNYNKAADFLKSLAGPETESGKHTEYDINDYFFATSDSISLEDSFDDIVRDISFSLEDYTVQDYIDPRFDLVVKIPGDENSKLLHLNQGGNIEIENFDGTSEKKEVPSVSPITEETGYKIQLINESDAAAKTPTLYWDGEMYYLRWDKQEIPGCAEDSASLDVWNATITLQAKEDFIGGNAVLTNGQGSSMNYVYYAKDDHKSSGIVDRYHSETNKGKEPEDSEWTTDIYPSKGFPRVTVNVGLLPRVIKSEQVIYMGEAISPLEIAKALADELKENDDENKGSHYYWEYLERYALAHKDIYGDSDAYDAILCELILGKSASSVSGVAEIAEDSLDEPLIIGENIADTIDIDTLSDGSNTLRIPYSYLPAATEEGKAGTQTGGSAHKADVLGWLTYSWTEKPGIETDKKETPIADANDGSYVTRNTDERIYEISVVYEPLQESEVKTASIGAPYMEIDLNETDDRTAANGKLIAETESYHWTKDAVGDSLKNDPDYPTEEKPISSTGTHTIKIVRGELALKVSAKKSFLEHWFSQPGIEDLEVKVNVERDPTVPGVSTLTTGEDGGDESLFEEGGDGIRPLELTIKEKQWVEWSDAHPSASDDDEVSFYTYYNKDSANSYPYSYAPQKLPIGTYTLTLAENSLFKTLEYANEDDYAAHFEIGSDGVIVDSTDPPLNDPTKDEDGDIIGNEDTASDDEKGYIAERIDKSVSPKTIGFYLGTEPTSGIFKPNGPYLDDRLGMVQVDIKTGSLEVSKIVTGDPIDKEKEFTFEVTLYTSNTVAPESVATEINGDFCVNDAAGGYKYSREYAFINGVARFTLKNGEKVKFDNLPAGLTYTVTETDNEGYTVTTTTTSASSTPVPTETSSGDVEGTVKGHPKTVSGTIAADEVEEVQFTNDRQPVTPELKLTKNLNTNGYTLPADASKFNFLLTPDETEDRKNPASDPVKKKLAEKEASGGTGTAGEGEGGETLSVTVAKPAEGSGQKAWTGTIENIFKDLQYTEPGVYVYKLTEGSGSVTGMEYDPTVYTVTVTVKEGEETDDAGNILYGDLTAEVSVSSEPPASGVTGSEVVFENTYSPKQTLTVKKELIAEKPLTLTEKDRSYAFPFTVEIKDNLDKKVTNKTYTYKINEGEEQELSLDNNGKGSLALKDGQTAVIEGLPAGYEAVVTEGRTVACYSLDSITSDSKAVVTGTEKIDTTKTTEVTGSYTGRAALEGAGLNVTFTNKKSLKPVKVSLTAQKELLIGEDRQALSADQFSFTITASEANPESAPAIASPVTNAASGLITFFQDAVFSEAGTYSYTIREVDDGKSGYTYDGREFTVKVVVAEEFAPDETGESTGRLKAGITVEVKNPQEEGSGAGTVPSEDSTVKESGPDSDGSYTYSVSLGTFVNEYHTGGLKVSKTVDGKDGDQTKPFNFTVTLRNRNGEIATDVDGRYPEPDGMEFKQGTATFQLKHGESWTATGLPAGLRYTVTEQEANTDGYGTVVTGDGTNGTGDIPQDDTAAVVFTNTKPATSIILEGNKIYYVGDGPQSSLTEGQFTFELKAKSGVPMPAGAVTAADGTVTATTGNKADGSFEFGGINYTQVGTYDYTIAEKRPASATGQDSSLIYDETVYDVTVKVDVDSETSHYKATAVYKPQDGNELEAAAFANFTPVKTETLPGEEKNVFPGQTITYTVTWRNPGKNAASVIVTDTLDTGVDYVSADSPGVYDAASRTVIWDLGEKQGGDSGTVTLTVKVNDSAVAEVANKATVKVGNDQSAVTNEVKNPLGTPAEASLTAQKNLNTNGHEMSEAARAFTFVLTPESSNPEGDPVKAAIEKSDQEAAALEQTVTVGTTGDTRTGTTGNFFEGLLFRRPGTYVYKLTEKAGNVPGMSYDGTAYEVTVAVAEGSGTDAGKLIVAVTISPDENVAGNVVTFTNTYHVGDLTVSKTVTGNGGEPGREFHFTVTLSDQDGNKAVDITGSYGDMTFNQGVANVTLTHGQSVTAKNLPAGIRYAVTETEENQDGYGTEATNATGTIPEGDSVEASFINTKPIVELGLNGLKIYKVGDRNAAFGENAFTFRLEAVGSVPALEAIPMPNGQTGAVGATASTMNGADGGFTFAGLQFRRTGTYSYKITEDAGTENMLYDETVYLVTVEVTRADDGNLNANVTYQTQGGAKAASAVFTNFTPEKAENEPGENKTVPANQEISYEIAWMNPGADPAEVTVTDALDKNVTFVSAGGGEYSYDKTSHSVTWNLGLQPGGTSGKVTLTVKVNADAAEMISNQATLHVGNRVAVTNEVQNPVEEPTASLTVTKTVTGTAADEHQLFLFRVTLSDKSVNGNHGDMNFQNGVAEFSLKHGESATASGLPAGIDYKVEETDSGEYTVTSEGAQGQLTAAENIASFVNTLDGPEPAIPVDVALNVRKTLKAAEAETMLPDQTYEFTFEIHAADTNPDADPLGNTDPVAVSVGPLDWTEDKLVNATYTEAGTYHYEVKERFGFGTAGIVYDEEVHELTVTVTETENAAGIRALSAAAELDGEAAALPVTVEFGNTYHKDLTNVILHGKKTLENGTLQDGQFTFTLTPVSADVERTVPATPSAATIDEETDAPAQQDGQAPQTEAAQQDGQTPQADAQEQDDDTPQTDAAEQDGQAPQTDAAEQDGETPQTDAVQQNDQTAQTDVSMMKYRATASGGHSFPGSASVSGGHSFPGAALMGGRRVVRSAPAMLAEEIITEPVDGFVPDPAAESVQEPEAVSVDDGEAVSDFADAAVSDAEMGEVPDADEVSGSGQEDLPEDGFVEIPEDGSGDMPEGDLAEIPEDGSGDLSEDEILTIPEDEFQEIPEGDSWDEAESGQEDGAEAAGESGTEDQAIVLDGEPVEVMPVSEEEELQGTTTETVALSPEEIPMPADAENGIATVKNGRSGAFDFGSIMYTEPGTYRYEIREQKGEDIDKIKYDETVYDVTVTVVRDEASEALAVQGVEYKVRTEDGNGETKALAEFTNRVYTGSLTVSKTVTASEESLINRRKAFAFTVTLSDPAINGVYGDMKFENGVAKFSLRHEEHRTASGLPAGISYQVEEGADADYTCTSQGASGSITTDAEAQAVFTNAWNEPKPEPEPEPEPEVGSLSVTKVTRDFNTGDTIVLVDAQFYVALFSDSTLTQRVSDAKAIRFSGSSASTSVTFADLEAGTYYVSETDADGKPASGGEYGGGVYSARYPDGQQVTISGQGSRTEFSFENDFSTLPDPQHYKNMKELVITKNVLDANGAALNTSEVFYAGIFADAGYTQLANHVSRNIVALEMGGTSSVSATVQVTVPSEGEKRLYITEVDANGTPVANSGSFKYTVSVVGGLVSLNIDSASPTVTITNTLPKASETETETEPETEPESESEITDEPESGDGGSGGGAGGVGSDASAAKTADETPVGRMLLLMTLSAAALLIAGNRRRKGRLDP